MQIYLSLARITYFQSSSKIQILIQYELNLIISCFKTFTIYSAFYFRMPVHMDFIWIGMQRVHISEQNLVYHNNTGDKLCE